MTEDKVAALRSEIEQTRAELGETVEQLAYKVDVKARAKEKVEETKARAAAVATQARDKARDKVRETAHELRTEPAVPARRAAVRMRTSVRERPAQWATAAAALLAFAALVVRKRRRAAAKRLTPQSLRDDWRRQWEANK